MSARHQLELALRAVRTCRAHLRRAREYARAVHLDERVLLRLQAAFEEERALITLADEAGTAEARRAVAARRHGRAA